MKVLIVIKFTGRMLSTNYYGDPGENAGNTGSKTREIRG
jgi:hypothetical protein